MSDDHGKEAIHCGQCSQLPALWVEADSHDYLLFSAE